MYKSKPVNSICIIESYPTVMYNVKSFYADFQNPSTSGEAKLSKDSSLDLASLSKEIQCQQRRLTRLDQKISQFCEDLSLSHLNKTADTKNLLSTSVNHQPELLPGRVTTKTLKKSCVEDLVVHVSYKTIPLAFLTACAKLATKFKCFIQFYTHGTAVNELKKDIDLKKKLEAVEKLFHALKLDLVDSRNSYDFGISIVWKRVVDQSLSPMLIIDSKSSVYGESNIVRYLYRLIQTNSALEKDLDAMDKCSNQLIFSQQHESYLAILNKSIEPGKFISFGERAGMADLYIWSILKQTGFKDAKKFQSIFEWMNLVENSFPMLQMLNHAL